MSESLYLEKIKNDYFKLRNPMVVIGFFDGVHLGHKKIINICVEKAGKSNSISTVLTFNRPPVNIIKNKMQKKLIISYEEKIKIIDSLGVDFIITANIDSNFLKLSPEQFCKNILVEKLNIKEIFVGDGFRFGYKAGGDVLFLKEFFKPYGVKVNIIPLLKIKGEIVSSTAVRKYYSEGKIKKIADMLGRNPCVEGVVVKGAGRGRELGFPTANIDVCKIYVTPRDGVYLGKVLVYGNKQKSYPAVVNIGDNPTFKDTGRRIEAFLLNFKDDIYGGKIRITFFKRLRDEVTFDDKSKLISQIKMDIEYAGRYFNINNSVN